MATPQKKKPARGFKTPTGYGHDWRQRRYVKAVNS